MVADILGAQADTTAPKLIIGEGRNMKNAKVYVAEQTDATTNTKTNEAYFSNKVTVTGLSANTAYYYSYEKEDGLTQRQQNMLQNQQIIIALFS